MKIINTLLLACIISLLFGSCSCKCTEQNTLDMNNTTFDDKFECLDLDFLIKNDQSSYGGLIYEEKYSNGNTKIYIQRGLVYISVDPSRFLSIYKSFDDEGKIKAKCMKNDLGFFIGEFYKFNSLGMLVSTEDMEKGYDFTFDQLKEVLIRDEKLSFDNLVPSYRGVGPDYDIKISRYSDPNPVWEVNYDDESNPLDGIYGTRITIIYDGKTGKRMSRDVQALNP